MVTRTAYDTFYMINGSNASWLLKERILSEFIPWIRERLVEYGHVSDGIMAQIWDIAKYELCKKKIPDTPNDVRKWLDKILTEGR